MFGYSSVIHLFLSFMRAAVFSFLVFPSMSGLLWAFSSNLLLVSCLNYFFVLALSISSLALRFSCIVGSSGQYLNSLFLIFIVSSSVDPCIINWNAKFAISFSSSTSSLSYSAWAYLANSSCWYWHSPNFSMSGHGRLYA